MRRKEKRQRLVPTLVKYYLKRNSLVAKQPKEKKKDVKYATTVREKKLH